MDFVLFCLMVMLILSFLGAYPEYVLYDIFHWWLWSGGILVTFPLLIWIATWPFRFGVCLSMCAFHVLENCGIRVIDEFSKRAETHRTFPYLEKQTLLRARLAVLYWRSKRQLFPPVLRRISLRAVIIVMRDYDWTPYATLYKYLVYSQRTSSEKA